MIYAAKAKELIKIHEGLRKRPYKCTAGKLTLGYGRNIEDRGISSDEADFMLRNDLTDIMDDIKRNAEALGWSALSDNRRIAIMDLIFNLGISRFLKFRKTLQHLRDENYYLASLELLDSNYASQLPYRSATIAKIIRDDELPESIR